MLPQYALGNLSLWSNIVEPDLNAAGTSPLVNPGNTTEKNRTQLIPRQLMPKNQDCNSRVARVAFLLRITAPQRRHL